MGRNSRGNNGSLSARVARSVLATAFVGGAGLFVLVSPAGASPAPTGFEPGSVAVASITDGPSATAPWNTSQGDPSATAYPTSDLLPSFVPGGPTTSAGGAEPNVSVYPSASSGTDGTAPYPSGTVGTPGPLDGYCTAGSGATSTQSAEAVNSPSANAVLRQPTGEKLPFSPDYFPHIVKNSDGTLTGYFDYRPKDTDEALVVATSSDNGVDWTYQGEALEQNPELCPSADVNDDGEGHANVLSIGGNSYLYTLPRAAGDNAGVGMLVHPLGTSVSESAPLGNLPTTTPTEKTGIDPDNFAVGGVTVANTGSATIAFTNPVGSGPEAMVPGEFIDLTATPSFNASTVINCTTVNAQSLSGCTTTDPSGIAITPNSLIEQVIGTITAGCAKTPSLTIPAGPNATSGDAGNTCLTVSYTNQTTAGILNANAPNRVYMDGVAVYCSQANASPTTEIEDCTTGGGGSPLTLTAGDPMTSDPIVPATAEQTNGLVAPDGIVGELPSYPAAAGATIPSGATYVLYTEKLLNYYIAGVDALGKVPFTSTTYTFFPSATTAQSLPASGSFTVYMGDLTVEAATVNAAKTAATDVTVPVTCTGWNTAGPVTSGQATDVLTGCSAPTSIAGEPLYKQTDTTDSKEWIGAPGAATVDGNTLALTGEGSVTNAQKLWKNNEDYTQLRVAYTTDGINFSSTGLANNGVISDTTQGNGSYSGINDPSAAASPSNLNAYATPDTPDALEMRWVGSAGTVVSNIDGNGTIGLFLSGAWAGDGDSDAFNQVYFATSSDGEHWSVPTSVVSTDYTFSASIAQQGTDNPLGVSAYYSGRAYGPSVVANGDGSYTLVFAGYRLPKGVGTAGNTVGTGSTQYSVGTEDPNLYRNILAVQLSPVAPAQTPEAPGAVLLPIIVVAVLGGGYGLRRLRRRRAVA